MFVPPFKLVAARSGTNDELEKVTEPTAYFRLTLYLDDLSSFPEDR